MEGGEEVNNQEPIEVRLRKVAIVHFDGEGGSGNVPIWQMAVHFPQGSGVLAEGEDKLEVIERATLRIETMLEKMRVMKTLNENDHGL